MKVPRPAGGADLHGRYVMMREQENHLVPGNFDPTEHLAGSGDRSSGPTVARVSVVLEAARAVGGIPPPVARSFCLLPVSLSETGNGERV